MMLLCSCEASDSDWMRLIWQLRGIFRINTQSKEFWRVADIYVDREPGSGPIYAQYYNCFCQKRKESYCDVVFLDDSVRKSIKFLWFFFTLFYF